MAVLNEGIAAKLKSCPACHGRDVCSTFQGVAMRFVQCSTCGLRGPDDSDPESAERRWNALPRDPEPMALRQAIGILNDHGHMATRRWTESDYYGDPMASNGLSNLTEFEAVAIAREYERTKTPKESAEVLFRKLWDRRDAALRLSRVYRNKVFKVYQSPQDAWVCGDCSPYLEQIEGAGIVCVAACKNGRVTHAKLPGCPEEIKPIETED